MIAILRHACGYALANRGHDTRALQAYLGHKNIHTVRYTRAVTDEIQELLAGVSVSRSCVARYS